MCHRLPFCHQPSSFPSWQSRSALAPRLASPIRVPQVPYSRVLGPRTPATRRKHQRTRNNAASIDMAIVMRIIGKFDRKILVAALFPSWPQRASQWRPLGPCWAPLTPSQPTKIDRKVLMHVLTAPVQREFAATTNRYSNQSRRGRCGSKLQKTSLPGWNQS